MMIPVHVQRAAETWDDCANFQNSGSSKCSSGLCSFNGWGCTAQQMQSDVVVCGVLDSADHLLA
jgi:hypothetical protein